MPQLKNFTKEPILSFPEYVGGSLMSACNTYSYLNIHRQEDPSFFDWPSLIADSQRLCAVSHPKRP